MDVCLEYLSLKLARTFWFAILYTLQALFSICSSHRALIRGRCPRPPNQKSESACLANYPCDFNLFCCSTSFTVSYPQGCSHCTNRICTLIMAAATSSIIWAPGKDNSIKLLATNLPYRSLRTPSCSLYSIHSPTDFVLRLAQGIPRPLHPNFVGPCNSYFS